MVIFAYFFIPQIFFYGMDSLLGAILNVRGRFGANMWTPVINNVVVIFVGILFFVTVGKPGTSSATISGYCQGVEYSGSVEHVFQWVTENGPAPNICPRFARIEIIESIAVVHLEVQHWSGKLAGAEARASDVFTLLKWNGEWKITHKLFHWHDR